jgi:hypothetical protein
VAWPDNFWLVGKPQVILAQIRFGVGPGITSGLPVTRELAKRAQLIANSRLPALLR